MSKPETKHTMESLLARSVEVGNCNEWTGYNRNKTPSVFYKGRIHGVRRVMLYLQGKTIPQNYFVSSSCGNPKCVNPAHITMLHPSQHATKIAQLVDYGNVQRIIKCTAKAQVRRKLTDEQVQIILDDPRNCRELSELFNVNKSLVSRIRRGKSHRMTLALNNPFFQLYG